MARSDRRHHGAQRIDRQRRKRDLAGERPLADSRNDQLFLREVEIWKPLRHENILELWGASYSRPFFLVSPYMLNANLLSFLRSGVGADAHKIRLMLGIADGMSYLHSRDVCHGVSTIPMIMVSQIINSHLIESRHPGPQGEECVDIQQSCTDDMRFRSVVAHKILESASTN